MFKLRKQPDGDWRVDIDSEFKREPGLNEKLRGMVRITDEMAAEIAAGQHTTVDAARKAMAEKYAALNTKPPPAPAVGDGLD
jgi:hypothetical protein